MNVLLATFPDQLIAWDDFHRVEHDALVGPAEGARFLAAMLFVWQCPTRLEILM